MPAAASPARACDRAASRSASSSREHEPGLLGERDELPRVEHAALGVRPAGRAPPRRRSGRCAAPPRAGTTRRSSPRRERVAELLLVTEPALDRLAQLDVEHLDAVAAALLRPVLRGVGVREQGLGVVGRVEVGRDADARGDVEAPAGDLRTGRRTTSATRSAIAIASPRPCSRSSSIVNSSPPSRASTSWLRIIRCTRLRDLDEQHVADRVAERVVDDLEPVDVEVQHADRSCRSRRAAADGSRAAGSP